MECRLSLRSSVSWKDGFENEFLEDSNYISTIRPDNAKAMRSGLPRRTHVSLASSLVSSACQTRDSGTVHEHRIF